MINNPLSMVYIGNSLHCHYNLLLLLYCSTPFYVVKIQLLAHRFALFGLFI